MVEDMEKAGAELAVGVFDQALDKRVDDRCIERPYSFGKQIVGVKDMCHLCWWTCCSVFDLCEESCFLPCIKHLKLDYRGKQKIFGSCFSIKLSIHYEHFLMAWIDAVTRLLSELYEPQELQDSGELVTVTAVTLASVVKHAVRLSPLTADT